MTTITRHRGRTSIAISLIAALLLALPLPSVRAASTSTVVSPNQATSLTGNTYGGWSALWVQYVAAQPTSSNPLNGADCGVGQSGPVFFLVGTNGSGSATRSCTVPANKYLFYPLDNAYDFHVACNGQNANVCDTNTTDTLVWADLHTANYNFSITSSYATIDPGGAVSGYRACAGPDSGCSAPSFNLTFPSDNLFSSVGLPQGTYGPAVADGIYLLLAPLTPGHHTLTFGGTGSFGGKPSHDNITYNLTVSS